MNIVMIPQEDIRLQQGNNHKDNLIDVSCVPGVIMADTYEMPRVRVLIKRKDRAIRMFVFEHGYNEEDAYWDDAEVLFDNWAKKSE